MRQFKQLRGHARGHRLLSNLERLVAIKCLSERVVDWKALAAFMAMRRCKASAASDYQGNHI